MDIDMLEELERMAAGATAPDAQQSEEFPTEEQITRWKTLFGYSRREALSLIKAQRSDVTRTRVTDEHWNLVRSSYEARGHDRETYEHTFTLQDVKQNQSSTITVIDKATGEEKTMVLFRMGGLLNSPEKVQHAAGLDEPPKVVQGQSEMGMVDFCMVDMEVNGRINEWLAQQAVVGGIDR